MTRIDAENKIVTICKDIENLYNISIHKISVQEFAILAKGICIFHGLREYDSEFFVTKWIQSAFK